MKLIKIAMVVVLVLQVFYLGWYSGSNHANMKRIDRDVNCQGEIERERVKNEILAEIVGARYGN